MTNIAFAVGKLDRRSGIVKVVKNIMEALHECDYDLTLITTGVIDLSYKDELVGNNINVINLDIEKYGNKKKYLYYVSALKQCFLKHSFDSIIVSGTEHVLFYAIGTSKLKSDAPRLIVWEHRNFSAGPKFRLEWFGKRYALKHWDGVICITKKDADQYIEYAGSENKVHQIYNLSDFNGSRKGYDIESKKIISCGYLAHIKGFDMLMDVAKTVFAKYPDWSWDIYGEGAEREHLEELIHDRCLDGHVVLKGYANNINELYGEYAFFVLTSRAEGMGMVLVEAQKSGLPVVSFDIKCGPSDIITNGKNGYLVKPFDLNEMSNVIISLIENSDMRKHFSEQSEMNLGEFEREYIINKWIGII